jgi:predicted anti-sigma-YlaC factor YlaD
MTCQDATLSLGVYLLGALDPTERAVVEDHLRDCAACRAQLAELSGLPPLLERLDLDDLDCEPLEVPDELFDRVAAQAREEDRAAARARRYRRLVAVAAAAVLVVVVALGSLAVYHHNGTHHGTVAANTDNGVTMKVVLASQASGTGLHVTVSGLPRDEHCKLIAVAKDGTRDVAGRWDATYLGWAQVTGSTNIPQSELSQLVLLGNGGTHLVTVNV